MAARRSQVLLEDPELAQDLRGPRAAAAIRDSMARTVYVDAGVWSPEAVGDMRDGIGLLILDGMLVYRVGVGGRFGAELVGDGDLLQPSQGEGTGTVLPETGRWRALYRCRIAVLDSHFAARMVPYPEVISALFGRAVTRSRRAAVAIAIVHHPRVDVRLQTLFWTLADRWGSVHTDGVHVSVRLPHDVLADLVAASRPTVTTALIELAERGAVIWTGHHWLLAGGPPVELDAVKSVSIARRRDAPDSPPARVPQAPATDSQEH